MVRPFDYASGRWLVSVVEPRFARAYHRTPLIWAIASITVVSGETTKGSRMIAALSCSTEVKIVVRMNMSLSKIHKAKSPVPLGPG
jgi:hypothetical protein